MRDLAEREARRSFKRYVKTNHARQGMRETHDRMKLWRSDQRVLKFWNLVKSLEQPIIAKDTVKTTKNALCTSFIHNLFDEDVVATYQSGCMLSYFDVCTLLRYLEELGYDLGEDVKNPDTTWRKLGGVEISVDLTELTESDASQTGRSKSGNPFTRSKLFRCVGSLETSKGLLDKKEVVTIKVDEEEEDGNDDVSCTEEVTEDTIRALCCAADVSRQAAMHSKMIVTPVLAFVTSISASRASLYAVKMARFQIVRAASIRAFKVASEASRYARESYLFARKVPIEIPRISLERFAERVVFESDFNESTKQMRDTIFEDTKGDLRRCLDRCDRAVARSELFPSYREQVVSRVLDMARKIVDENDQVFVRLNKIFDDICENIYVHFLNFFYK